MCVCGLKKYEAEKKKKKKEKSEAAKPHRSVGRSLDRSVAWAGAASKRETAAYHPSPVFSRPRGHFFLPALDYLQPPIRLSTSTSCGSHCHCPQGITIPGQAAALLLLMMTVVSPTAAHNICPTHRGVTAAHRPKPPGATRPPHGRDAAGGALLGPSTTFGGRHVQGA